MRPRRPTEKLVDTKTRPPRVSLPPASEVWDEMLMVQIPTDVQALWSPRAQQEIIVRMVEELGRAMRETMHGQTREPAAPAQDPEDGTVPDAPVRHIRPSGTE